LSLGHTNLSLSPEEPLQTALGNLLHQLPGLLIAAHPSTHGGFQRLRNIDHFTLISDTKGQAEPRMKLSLGTLTSLFATDATHGDEAAAEEGLVVHQLSQPGSGNPFGTRKLSPVSHRITSFYLIYYNITDLHTKSSLFLNANLLSGRIWR
jgi:hypothetical protein